MALGLRRRLLLVPPPQSVIPASANPWVTGHSTSSTSWADAPASWTPTSAASAATYSAASASGSSLTGNSVSINEVQAVVAQADAQAVARAMAAQSQAQSSGGSSSYVASSAVSRLSDCDGSVLAVSRLQIRLPPAMRMRIVCFLVCFVFCRSGCFYQRCPSGCAVISRIFAPCS